MKDTTSAALHRKSSIRPSKEAAENALQRSEHHRPQSASPLPPGPSICAIAPGSPQQLLKHFLVSQSSSSHLCFHFLLFLNNSATSQSQHSKMDAINQENLKSCPCRRGTGVVICNILEQERGQRQQADNRQQTQSPGVAGGCLGKEQPQHSLTPSPTLKPGPSVLPKRSRNQVTARSIPPAPSLPAAHSLEDNPVQVREQGKER